MSQVTEVKADSGYERLETQIEWYDDKSGRAKRMFTRLKTATLATSVSIPLAAALAAYYPVVSGIKMGIVPGALGAAIALLEGLQQLNQYHQNWIAYRSTAEALKHEKFLFLSKAGPYANPANGPLDPKVLLAERVESLVSQEHSKWTQAQQTMKDQKEAKDH